MRLVVVDGLALAYRAHFARYGAPLVNSRGEIVTVLSGVASTLLKLRRELDAADNVWAMAWDPLGPTFRHLMFADYKATRKARPPELNAQAAAVKRLANALGFHVLEIPGVEADDVIATLAHCASPDHQVIIVATDKDLMQLLGPYVSCWHPATQAWVHDWTVRQVWGVAPAQLPDVQALLGDAADNIPGAPGIGEKTAVELVARFGTIDALYERLDEVRPRVRRLLEAARDSVTQSRALVALRVDVPLPVLLPLPVDLEEVRAIAALYELGRLESWCARAAVTA